MFGNASKSYDLEQSRVYEDFNFAGLVFSLILEKSFLYITCMHMSLDMKIKGKLIS